MRSQSLRTSASRHGGEAGIARLFEMTSDLLATISLEGRFTLLNPAWEQLLGWSRGELQSQPVSEFVHPDDAEQLLGPMRAGHGHPAEVENFTTRFRHRDGSWHWLLWSARRDGEIWYAAAKDVTDRMWLERQAMHDPLTQPPQPHAADGPRASGDDSPAPQPGRAGDAVHRPRQVQGGQRQPRPRRRRPAARRRSPSGSPS